MIQFLHQLSKIINRTTQCAKTLSANGRAHAKCTVNVSSVAPPHPSTRTLQHQVRYGKALEAGLWFASILHRADKCPDVYPRWSRALCLPGTGWINTCGPTAPAIGFPRTHCSPPGEPHFCGAPRPVRHSAHGHLLYPTGTCMMSRQGPRSPQIRMN